MIVRKSLKKKPDQKISATEDFPPLGNPSQLQVATVWAQRSPMVSVPWRTQRENKPNAACERLRPWAKPTEQQQADEKEITVKDETTVKEEEEEKKHEKEEDADPIPEKEEEENHETPVEEPVVEEEPKEVEEPLPVEVEVKT